MGETKIFVVISFSILTYLIYHSYLMMPIRCHYNSIDDVEKLQESWNWVFSHLKMLRQNHIRLVLRLQDFPGVINESTLQLYTLPGLYLEEKSPTEEYETVRRRIYLGTKELWYYVNHQLRRLFNKTLKLEQRQTIVNELAERKRWLLIDQERLRMLEGHEEWRRREEASVSDLLQRRLHHLQNPPDCQAAKKLICHHDGCGFGCKFHHLVYYLVTAYSLKRTLILQNYDRRLMYEWNKSHTFYTLSETCTETNFLVSYSYIPVLSAKTYNDGVVYLGYLREFKYIVPVLPYFIPKDLAKRISRFNGDPYSWWIGQMLKYILRLQRPEVVKAMINLKSPIVGVHIRRTDKVKYEAEYHDVEEYMSHVEDYYAQLELTQAVDQRRVYLATDDVNVLKEAIERYPNYTFYGDYYNAKMAAVRSRITLSGFTSFFTDLYMLVLCDYVVGTFSSNFGRMVYELMQASGIDAVNRFTSVDYMHYFTINEKRLRTAVMRNKKISLDIGDLIEHKCYNDIVTGTVLRTNDKGRIPWHKTKVYLLQFPYPEYEQVPLFTNNSPLLLQQPASIAPMAQIVVNCLPC